MEINKYKRIINMIVTLNTTSSITIKTMLYLINDNSILNGEDFKISPSKIAKVIGCDRARIYESMNALNKLGIIKIDKVNGSNIYKIIV